MWPFNRNNQDQLIVSNDEAIRYSALKSEKISRGSKRMFAGAQLSRLTADFIAQGTSIDAEIKSSLPRLRDRSRQLCRDNDYARSVIRAFRNNIIGRGVTMQSQVKMRRGDKLDKDLNAKIEFLWKKWKKKQYCHTAGRLSFSSIERLLIDSAMISGEVYVRKVREAMGGSRIPLALEIIESDHLDETMDGFLSNGNRVKMGVEMDSWERPVAYHFRKKHPGDYMSFSGHDPSGVHRIRVPAREIIPLFISERVSQTRGVPLFASAIMRLHHLAGYEEAEVIAARASAALMGFIETDQGELEGDDEQDGELVTEFSPGVIKKLNAGEKMNVPQLNRPGNQFDPFVRVALRGVSAGVGASYESVSRDYSQTNYSSARQGIIEDRDNWRVLQQWIIEEFHQPVFEEWLDLAVISGEIAIKDFEVNEDAYKNPKWQPRGWSWVDPANEVAAAKEAVRCGFKTQTDIISEGGGDLEDFLSQRSHETKRAKELELVFDSNPSVVNNKGAAHSSAPEDTKKPDSKGEAV